MILQKNKIGLILNRLRKYWNFRWKVSETITFQTSDVDNGSISGHGTSRSFADVMLTPKEVFKGCFVFNLRWTSGSSLFCVFPKEGMSDQALIIQSIWMTFSISCEITSFGIDTKEIGSIWFEGL